MKAFNTVNSIIWSRHDISIYHDSDDIEARILPSGFFREKIEIVHICMMDYGILNI